MTSATIVHNARRRAGLTQAHLADRLNKSQSEIGRWERGEVQPSFETLQRIVAACGLELVAQTYTADDSYDAHIARALELAPGERVRASIRQAEAFTRLRPGESYSPLNPLRTLGLLVRHQVRFVVIGALAEDVHGSPLPATGLEVTPDPSTDNLDRAEAVASAESDLDLVIEPAGTQGYDDLRRDATTVDLGDGLVVQVASVRDLIRMKEASGRAKDMAGLPALRAVLARTERGAP